MKMTIHARALLALILILVPLAIFSALKDAVSLMFLFYALLGTCLFWIIITGWVEENKERIRGRTFEFLFFLFLFSSSYFITVASSSVGPSPLNQRNFIRLLYGLIFVISAVFSGFLHYIKKIYN
jgi:hypothetical protein